ncbi:pyruvate, phosphate dikinase [Bacteroidetes/Chlorobi group bacterium Naka2016]|jgi:predicted nucleotidyltransferase|nr:MAG: pyruvate, phosphate dikinase [Bacteroidetes/Chlorobi group bacterium Naka2016]
MKQSNSNSNENLQNEIISKEELKKLINTLGQIDPYLFSVISRKMLNYLLFRGYPEAKEISNFLWNSDSIRENFLIDNSQPTQKNALQNSLKYSKEIFDVASNHLSNEQMLYLIQKWLFEEKASGLLRLLTNQSIPLKEITEALRKYIYQTPNLSEMEEQYKSSPAVQGIRVALSRRLLSDQLEFVKISKNFLSITDFYELLLKTIITTEGIGRFGGKAAGLILASKIILNYAQENPHSLRKESQFSLDKIKTPKTWFIPSDAFYDFLTYNNLEDIIEQKYKSIDEIRIEYPNIIQVFKNSQFPPEMINGLVRALDDFGDNPIIVRSSSLLEDRVGTAFPGKYKSIFLANQGTKEEKLLALMDAIAEVYASTFSPDPIGYRIEHNLLDYNEEMGIMIQEVVGTKVGDYFFPIFSGVAFSYNDFRWSPRLERNDGLIRLVVGLGTRAVDRTGDDYPILISPGKPGLKVYTEISDYIKYSPHRLDAINLKTNKFETVSINELMKKYGDYFPAINLVFSILEEKTLRRPVGFSINPREQELLVTFDNLFTNTDFLSTIRKILNILESELGTPVDIEFAFNGESLYILQCRSQSTIKDSLQYEIPDNIAEEDLLFKSHKFVSNGKTNDLEYIVFVDPTNYSKITTKEEYIEISEAIGKLNTLLPAKKFVLIGPGRWGTRDDFRLGVKVTYSSIFNTACLIEIANTLGVYSPEVSFGTHFFQDLVESNILYIPIVLQEEGTIFNEFFINRSFNFLGEFLSEYVHLSPILKVVSIPKETGGKVLKIISSASSNTSIGFFSESSISPIFKVYQPKLVKEAKAQLEEPWELRWKFAEKMISKLKPVKYGVLGVYLFGTVYNKTASETSDLDLLFLVENNKENLMRLVSWLEPWEALLKEIIYINTGFNHPKPLDVKFITPEECTKENYYFNEIMNPTKNLSKKLL